MDEIAAGVAFLKAKAEELKDPIDDEIATAVVRVLTMPTVKRHLAAGPITDWLALNPDIVREILTLG